MLRTRSRCRTPRGPRRPRWRARGASRTKTPEPLRSPQPRSGCTFWMWGVEVLGARQRHNERGLGIVAVLAIALVLTLLAALILFVAGKETSLSWFRLAGSESLYVAEGGAARARAALMAYMGVYPTGITTIDPSLSGTTASGWVPGGSAA